MDILNTYFNNTESLTYYPESVNYSPTEHSLSWIFRLNAISLEFVPLLSEVLSDSIKALFEGFSISIESVINLTSNFSPGVPVNETESTMKTPFWE